MKIAIIFTGGTISGGIQNGLISPSQETKSELIKALDEDIEVESFQPYYILSEQLDGEYISKLIKCVSECQDVDGIIVTHGTDTLQYSAAALSIAFGNRKIPIVLVSANYILSDARSNGISNFKYAVKFIREKIGGVYVSYKNENGVPTIFFGDSLLPHLPYSDKLFSLTPPLGCYENEKFIKLTEDYKHSGEGVFTLSKKSTVLWLKPYAGMNYPSVEGFKAVLLEAYHSGTLPTEDEDFINFCKNCGVPIYLTGLDEGVRYESAKSYNQLNIVVLEKTSPIYAYISLWKDL